MMSLLMPLASLLGVEVTHLSERLKRGALFYGTVAVFVTIGVIFLLASLNAWLTTLWGPVIAPLAIGLGGLVLAGVIYIAMRLAGRATERRIQSQKHNFERTALVTTAAVSALPLLLKSGLMRNIGLPVGGALAALYLLRLPRAKDDTPRIGSGDD
jgi:uncharacterized membrane protein YciS (DUF1049 family)